MAVHYNEKTELSTTKSVGRKIIESSVENFNTEEEIDFDNLIIPGNYSDYVILEEERKTISKNYEVWIKNKKRYGEGGYC